MDDGLVTTVSRRSVTDTLDALEQAALRAGMTIFARIDHAANAIKAGLTLRPTEVLIFGNPGAGTALMQDAQTSGLDLPLRVLAWEDEDGEVFVTYTDLPWLARRYELTPHSGKQQATIEAGLVQLVRQATGT